MSQLSDSLRELPPGTVLRSVDAEPWNIDGRRAIRVRLNEQVVQKGKPDVDFIDMPTFAQLPIEFENGWIQIDILSRLTVDAPDYARGFAGIAYRVQPDAATDDVVSSFEAVYLRPMNGRKLNPPPPRDQRAVQYFAYPDWKYEKLRRDYPDGRFEGGADIGPGEWIRLRVAVDGTRVSVEINGSSALTISKTTAVAATGQIGLFVDIGTEAYFSNLTVHHEKRTHTD